jgi:cell division control protein 6
MKISNFFENFLKKKSIFLGKKVLQSNYIPDKVLYREEQIMEVANILAPALKLEKPSNIFLFGKTGTGKTLTIKHLIASMQQTAQKNNIPLKMIYINCKLKRVADTEYRLIAQLIKEFDRQIPSTGLPTDEVYNIFYNILEEKKRMIVLVLDEIDQLTKKIGDEILYNLTRINSELKDAQLCLVGISNHLFFSDNLDPRVKSSLSQEEILFPPYNALQIKTILKERAKKAFKLGVLKEGVIEKCAAYAAREHGDVRRAIDLLRIAGELAERSCSPTIEIYHLDDAEKKIEHDRVINIVINQPKQFQSVLYSVILINQQRNIFFTGEIYDLYKKICKRTRFSILTQRRISDIIAELDMLGLINAKIISKGRYGRTKEISLSLTEDIIVKLKEMLEKALALS